MTAASTKKPPPPKPAHPGTLPQRRTPESGPAIVCSVNDHVDHRCTCFAPKGPR